MTLRLIVVRHAKSNWDDPMTGDHERPLAPRGQKAAAAVAAWLGSRGFRPQTVLCSDARRTRETWEALDQGLDGSPEVRFLPALYQAACSTILDIVRQEATGSPVMVIGHNPGLGSFAAQLPEEPPRHPGFGRYPAGATTVIDFPAEAWADIGWGDGRVVEFVVPKDLT